MKFNKLIILALLSVFSHSAFTQERGASYEGMRITNVIYVFKNKLNDSIAQNTLEKLIKREFQVYPHASIRSILLESYTNKVRKLGQVSEAQYEIIPSQQGGINITLTVQINSSAKENKGKSGLLLGKKDFPILYEDNKTLLTTKFTFGEILYTNNNAWYGREDALLNGNPLAKNPAGEGFTAFVEGFASGGLYGITTLSTKNSIYLYGGASYLVSGSAGSELFTDKTRSYFGFEDAFIGLMGSVGKNTGSKFNYNLSVGRQQFSVGHGFIIVNTASNGDNRGTLQLNSRLASDYLGLASARYNNFTLQVFQLDPDELDIVDSKTIIQGFNAEWGDQNSNQIGLMMLGVPRSTYKYYTPTGNVLSRDGLQLFNVRYYANKAPSVPGLFFKGEVAYQRNKNFDMAAFAGYADLGWSFATSAGSPTLRYRYAYFSGDNPDTERFERWDPLLSGGKVDEWIIGANHFKVVQNSNMNVQQLQLSIRPWPRVEVLPQVIYMYAANKNNIGGNPALGSLKNKEYATELNISARYYKSRNWYWYGHVAYTIPGAGVQEAVGDNAKPWLSAMVFFRYMI